MDKDKLLRELFENDPLGLLNIKPATNPARNEDERLVASFREIVDFYEKHDRLPAQGGGIQEHQLYARLESMRKNPEKAEMLQKHDTHHFLQTEKKELNSLDDVFADDLLGLLDDDAEGLFELRHVPKETTMPDYIGKRTVCADFDQFESLFLACHKDLKIGKRKLLTFRNEQQIEKGYFFVLKGILLYVAEVGTKEIENGKVNARLRCIFENGTESDMLLRSLAAELYKDGRRVTEHEDHYLDGLRGITQDDENTGFIYILKSKSENPAIQPLQNLYKIGFSTITVEDRIKNARQDPTFLMADVRIVMTYQCYNMNPQKLEQLLHTFFGSSCLNVDVFDQAGQRHTPREWFLAPLSVIEQAVHLIISGEIVQYRYDAEKEGIVGR
jgi:hypothetical protein